MALLGLHGWENVIWIYILQRKKGPGGEAHCFCQIFKRVCNLKSVAIRGSNLFPLQWYFPWSVNVASFPITVSHRAETEWHVGFAFRNSVSAALVFFQARQKKKKKKHTNPELNSFTSTLTQRGTFQFLSRWERQCPHQASHNPLSLDYYWSLTPGSDSTPWVYTVSLSTHSLRLLPANENNIVLIVEGKNRLPKQVVHLPEFLLAVLILQLQVSITTAIG